MKYNLKKKDFDEAFGFSIKYWLDPNKPAQTRTAGSVRGLGGVLDAFMHGKLVELGVVNVLESNSTGKELLLDFDIKKASEVNLEPDIERVKENDKERPPEVFVEIKHISETDQWIGLTKEQFDTTKSASGGSSAYIIGASLSHPENENEKIIDPLGMYLKHKYGGNEFEDFSDLEKMKVNIEYALSLQELETNGNEFKQNDLFYQTNILPEAGPNDTRDTLGGSFPMIESGSSGEIETYMQNGNWPAPSIFEPIEYDGQIEIYEKQNANSKKRLLKTNSDVLIKSAFLGEFHLEKDKVYTIAMTTLGRNPVLSRNNIWIAKRAFPYLVSQGKLVGTEETLKEIAKKI